MPSLLQPARLLPLFTATAMTLAVMLPATLLPQASAQNGGSITGQLQFAEGDYRVSVGDTLGLTVYNQPDLTSTGVVVRPDGMASFTGIGELLVAGKTVHQVTNMVSEELRELVKDPHVSLNVTDMKAPIVYLAGAVLHPGMLQSGSPSSLQSSSGTDTSHLQTQSGGSSTTTKMDFRLSSILSAAGGVTMDADLNNVVVTRDGAPFRNVNLWNMLRTGDASQDLMLQSGDSVYIPKLAEQALDDTSYKLLLNSTIGPRTFPIRIIGEIKNPGILDLVGTSPFLNSAIAKGGGYSPSANKRLVAIRRFTGETKFSTLFVDPNKFDFVLHPNDVIYISELKIYKTGRFAEEVSRILSPFNTLSSTAFSYALLKNNSNNRN